MTGPGIFAAEVEHCTVAVQDGPRLTWSQVMSSRHCQTEEMCAIFKDRHPSTVAMTVLVVVEMFNALNALSENNSLLQVCHLALHFLPCLGPLTCSACPEMTGTVGFLHCRVLYMLGCFPGMQVSRYDSSSVMDTPVFLPLLCISTPAVNDCAQSSSCVWQVHTQSVL